VGFSQNMQEAPRCPACGAMQAACATQFSIDVSKDPQNGHVVVGLDVKGLGKLHMLLSPEEAIEIGEGMARAGRDLGGVHRNRG
jgi:hypothetical protein